MLEMQYTSRYIPMHIQKSRKGKMAIYMCHYTMYIDVTSAVAS